MLKLLHIENIAVIEHSDIEFESGFNVLTGETGAGKSIVIDSINAVLGERASKDLIRAGCDTAEVSALFGDLSPECVTQLKEYGIEPDTDGNILITRRLSLNGKGFIKINAKPYTASVLREISDLLINIHGQHDNQALLNPEKHRLFIDAVAEDSDLLKKYYAEFKNLNRIRRELRELEADEDEKQRKTDLLEYQIKELKSADIKTGETEELKKKLAVAENHEAVLKALSRASALLDGEDDTDGALTLLQNAEKQLLSVRLPDFGGVLSKLSESLSLARDAAAEITAFLDSTEFSEFNSDELNNRLDSLQRLMLKYGGSEEKMLEFLSNAEAELEAISFADKRHKLLSDELDASTERLVDVADKLTHIRRAAADSFASRVCEALKNLNMPAISFAVAMNKGRYTRYGCDEIEFMISANVGEALKPLGKIASGGELSRIMLAIKSILAEKDGVGALIFDEIDTGISGYAADRVAAELKRLSRHKQVICVTHLAQLASAADCHLLIEKSISGGRTFTNVKLLDYDLRISEIARIMSGTEITENLYNSAKELLDRSIKQ